MIINSKEYWNERFKGSWQENNGENQTEFFCNLAIKNLPKWLKKELNDNPNSLCDIGCATGECTNILKNTFTKLDMTGADFSDNAINIAKEKYGDFFINKGIDELPKDYDITFCSNALEHFENPDNKLQKILDKTKKHLILMVPFKEKTLIPEHKFSFNYNFFKIKNGDFIISFYKIIDSSIIKNNEWPGKQILIIMTNIKNINLEDIPISKNFSSKQYKKLKKECVEQKKELLIKENEIKEIEKILHEKQAHLNKIYNGKIWRIISVYFIFRDKFIILKKIKKNSHRLINKFFEIINSYKDKKELEIIIKNNNNKNKKIIALPTIDWETPLYQRPQHLAIELAKLGINYFYCTCNYKYDSVKGFEEKQPGLYVSNKWKILSKNVTDSWIFLLSTQQLTTISDLKKYKELGHKIIYDYVDEIDPDISGSQEMANFLFERHNYIKDSQIADLVLCVSNKLYNEMIKTYPKEKVLLSQNGVNYNHFQIDKKKENLPKDMETIVNQKKPIIGYYGALANWIDYKLINITAKNNPNWNFVFIGVDYDNSLCRLNQNLSNIYYLGPKSYQDLPKYGIWFDVAMIPFVEGEIAKATSPLKFYEYMAMNKPTVITKDLEDCKNYSKVFISQNTSDFSHKINEAIKNKDKKEYINSYTKIAKDNTWAKRALDINNWINSHSKN